ncbi:hypothetical protein B0H13DRAFT_1900366 [Mycena leptocephala]|nr:hypothetical protein B0H13DRAFT_1900366 [Mycena leptocephala]
MLFKLPVLALFFSLAAHTQASSIGCQALCHTKWQNPTCFADFGEAECDAQFCRLRWLLRLPNLRMSDHSFVVHSETDKLVDIPQVHVFNNNSRIVPASVLIDWSLRSAKISDERIERTRRASQDWIELEVFGVRLEVSAFLSLETPARPEQEKEGLKWKPNSKYTSMITAVRRLESRQDLKWENEIVIIFRDPRKALCFATGFKWAYPWIVRKAKTYCKTLFDVE